MKKIYLLFVIAFIALTLTRLLAGGGEDTWVCTDGQWVKHGNPSSPPPQSGCGDDTPSPVVTTAAESTTDSIARSLSLKHNKPLDDMEVVTTIDTGTYAKGTVQFKDEPGGGLWLGAKTDNGWEVAFDGNGIVTCDAIGQYEFPTDIVPSCLDNQNNLIQR